MNVFRSHFVTQFAIEVQIVGRFARVTDYGGTEHSGQIAHGHFAIGRTSDPVKREHINKQMFTLITTAATTITERRFVLLQMQHDVSERVAVGLWQQRYGLVQSMFGFIFWVSDSVGERFPIVMRNQRIIEGSQEIFQATAHHVYVDIGQVRDAFAEFLSQRFHVLFRARDTVQSHSVESPLFNFVHAMNDQCRYHRATINHRRIVGYSSLLFVIRREKKNRRYVKRSLRRREKFARGRVRAHAVSAKKPRELTPFLFGVFFTGMHGNGILCLCSK